MLVPNQMSIDRAQHQAWLAERDAACAGNIEAALLTYLEHQYGLRLRQLESV
jgi:hypothetical protein